MWEAKGCTASDNVRRERSRRIGGSMDGGRRTERVIQRGGGGDQRDPWRVVVAIDTLIKSNELLFLLVVADRLLARQSILHVLFSCPQLVVPVREHASVLVRAGAVRALQVVAAQLSPEPIGDHLVPFDGGDQLSASVPPLRRDFV